MKRLKRITQCFVLAGILTTSVNLRAFENCGMWLLWAYATMQNDCAFGGGTLGDFECYCEEDSEGNVVDAGCDYVCMY